MNKLDNIKVYIYVLIDPLTCKIRYIGRTSNELNIRLNGHISKSKSRKTHKDCWIHSLLNKSKKPVVKLFKVVYGWEYSHEIEKLLINKCIKFGFDLTNTDDKGLGEVNKIITEEQKLKISKTLKENYKLGIIKPINTKPVSIFDLYGNFLKSYNSCSECCLDIKIPQSSIEKVLAKSIKRWKNYQITYGSNPGKYQKRSNYSFNDKKVVVINTHSNETLSFNSYKLTSKYFNVSTPTISRYIKSNRLYKNQYIFKNE